MIAEQLRSIMSRHRWDDKKIIVAVSGGADSMVLAALLHRCGAPILLAHCNFRLRGAESDGDEALVREWAGSQALPLEVRHFDTRRLLEERGGNLQELARELRYSWFEQLRREHGYELIATAHHRQDGVETMLINFFKGTGIAGMHGILPRQGRLIRPLLSFSKEELVAYAEQNGIPWREDSSNRKDDYTRNAVRHQLLPLAEKLFPNAVANLAGNIQRFAEAELLYREAVERYRRKLIEQRKNDWYIPVLKLQHVRPLDTILLELLLPFGFTAAQLKDARGLLQAESGRYLASATHRLIRDRNFLILTALESGQSNHILVAADDKRAEAPGFGLDIRYRAARPDIQELKKLQPHELCVDSRLLRFPLILRPWKTGDYFYPLGMGRKKKKVSRYLIGEKVPLHEKEKIWVLESDRKIVWVVGMRPDERFRITEKTADCYFFSVKPR